MGEEMKYNSGQKDLLSFKGMALSLDVLKAPCYSFLVCKIGKILTCLLAKLRNAPACINAEDYYRDVQFGSGILNIVMNPLNFNCCI